MNRATSPTATTMPMAKFMGCRGSELRALHVVAEHLAHRPADLPLGGVGAGAIQDALHEVRLAGRLARGGGQRLERGRTGLAVAGALDLRDGALLLVLDLLGDEEDGDLEL